MEGLFSVFLFVVAGHIPIGAGISRFPENFPVHEQPGGLSVFLHPGSIGTASGADLSDFLLDDHYE